MARRIRLSVSVDDRTTQMTEQALICRSSGHAWQTRARTRKRTHELASQGLMEFDRYCGNGCGSTWRQVWNVVERVMVENERRYPTGGEYLMKPGNGRMSRADAVPSLFARINPEYV